MGLLYPKDGAKKTDFNNCVDLFIKFQTAVESHTHIFSSWFNMATSNTFVVKWMLLEVYCSCATLKKLSGKSLTSCPEEQVAFYCVFLISHWFYSFFWRILGLNLHVVLNTWKVLIRLQQLAIQGLHLVPLLYHVYSSGGLEPSKQEAEHWQIVAVVWWEWKKTFSGRK